MTCGPVEICSLLLNKVKLEEIKQSTEDAMYGQVEQEIEYEKEEKNLVIM